jgi:hypothetical protein
LINKIFYPQYYIKDLIRLGNHSDGGYILSNKVIKKCDFLLSFGLGDNFRFESDLIKKNPKCKIYVYDHTVNFFYWIKHFFFWFWKSIRFRKYLKFLGFIDYIFFFKILNNKHYKIKISKTTCSLSESLKTNKINHKKTILKIDIDGDEYSVINEIKKYDFLCLIIEFENVHKNMRKIINFIKSNKNLSIIHIHGNNFLPAPKNIPQALEITFINSNLINKKLRNYRNYPIPNLDFPNNIMKKDINLFFKK